MRRAGIADVPLSVLKDAAYTGLAAACSKYIAEGSSKAFGSYSAPIIMQHILEALAIKQAKALPFYLRRGAVAVGV